MRIKLGYSTLVVALFLPLTTPLNAFAKNMLMPAKSYEQNTELFNGRTQDEIRQMPQNTFGDSGTVTDQFDRIDSDPNWINENE